ncbi:LysM peptidoglycan-binding domain-containing protein [bacterium]|nr:LysM peptidoglycan-binding domain-containing protein [bacterium]
MSTKIRQKFRLVMICVGIWTTLLLTMPIGQVEAQGAETVHIVRPGESLAQIAGRYGVSYMDLARYNGISNPNILRVGQPVRIPDNTVAVVPVLVQTPKPEQTPRAAQPTATQPAEAQPTATQPTATQPTEAQPVQQASIAAPTPIQAEVAPTRQVSSPEVQPVPTATKAAPVTVQPRVSNQACGTEISYSVRRGDSLYGISATYGVSVRTIIARNNLPSTLIYVGQRLIIPLPGC